MAKVCVGYFVVVGYLAVVVNGDSCLLEVEKVRGQNPLQGSCSAG